MLIDVGTDPRELERQQQVDKAAAIAVEQSRAVTVGDIWPRYLAEGKPKRKEAFKPRYRADLRQWLRPVESKRYGQGLTRPGVLYPLLALPLGGLDWDALKSLTAKPWQVDTKPPEL